jgi:broad specificity polyphosphatase/5'/3'-nucleotidase SurE
LANSAAVTRQIVDEVWQRGLPDGASLMTVNMPTSTNLQTPRRFTGVARTAYGSIFCRNAEEDRFDYRFSGLRVLDEGITGDVGALQEQMVAMTPVRFALDVEPTSEDRKRFERLPA